MSALPYNWENVGRKKSERVSPKNGGSPTEKPAALDADDNKSKSHCSVAVVTVGAITY